MKCSPFPHLHVLEETTVSCCFFIDVDRSDLGAQSQAIYRPAGLRASPGFFSLFSFNLVEMCEPLSFFACQLPAVGYVI